MKQRSVQPKQIVLEIHPFWRKGLMIHFVQQDGAGHLKLMWAALADAARENFHLVKPHFSSLWRQCWLVGSHKLLCGLGKVIYDLIMKGVESLRKRFQTSGVSYSATSCTTVKARSICWSHLFYLSIMWR